jgi:hypothetical protein
MNNLELTMDESTSNPLTEASDKFRAGYAVVAASILQKHAQRLSEQADGDGVEAESILTKSDAIAELGMKIFLAGDAVER